MPAPDFFWKQCSTQTAPAILTVAMMYQRVSRAKLAQFGAKLDITMVQALPHINESTQPFVNSDFN